MLTRAPEAPFSQEKVDAKKIHIIKKKKKEEKLGTV